MNFSPIIIGTMRWGIWGANHSVSKVQKLIENAARENLTTFDHADIYGNYTTEKLFGEAFSAMKLKRENVQFISKCGIKLPCENRNFNIKSYDLSSEHILKSVDQSLQNLKTDYLDVLLLHRPSPLMCPHEIAEAFSKLRENGKVKHFGVSNFSPSQFSLIEEFFPLITNQIEISVSKTAAFYDGSLDQLMQNKRYPMAWSVMGNYFSTDSAQNKRLKNVVLSLCKKYEAQENQIILAFLLKHPAKILPVIGTSRLNVISELKNALYINLSREDWFLLLEAASGKEVD